jgi:hypothetical protein
LILEIEDQLLLPVFLYRLIFCRITQVLHQIHDEENILIFDEEQKGFVPNRARCMEHAPIANIINNDAASKKKKLYVLSLYLRDAFGSISYNLIKTNMEKTGIQIDVRNVVLDSYSGICINMISKDEETGKIQIEKGAKQRCYFSQTLFEKTINTEDMI